jgi:hypothetical protein
MRLVPWRALVWACKRWSLCWPSLVSLKLDGIRAFWEGGRTIKPEEICFDAHPEPHDYCGAYGPDHPCYRAVVERRAKEPRP